MTSLLQIHEPGKTPHSHSPSDQQVIGIDLGTTHSLVAYVQEEKVDLVEFENGEVLVPSVVAYGDQEPLVGLKAITLMDFSSEDVLSSTKRFMGDRDKTFLLHDQSKTPREVAADILAYLKEGSEQFLKKPIKKCVLTVPAYFSEKARAMTRWAARKAGLDVLRLLSEPTAAAIAYGLHTQQEGLFVVYDFGGGTFDVTVLKLSQGVFHVLATGGDISLGGDDIDQAIGEFLCPAFSTFPLYTQKTILKHACKVKEFFSSHPGADWVDEHTGESLSHAQFQALASPFIERTLSICRKVLADAEIFDLSLIKEIILAGGSTRLTLVSERLQAFFGKRPLCTINPDEIVARGAALHAVALMEGEGHLVLDVTPLSLGMETLGGLVEKIIPRNTALPCAIAQDFTTSHTNQTSLVIHVVQGEREQVDHCLSLGKFSLNGIPALPAGMVRVRVTFSLDADGLLTVEAREKVKGAFETLEIKPFEVLEEEQILATLQESFNHARLDQEERLLRSARVEAHQLLEIVKEALRKDRDLLSDEEINAIQEIWDRVNSLKNEGTQSDLMQALRDLKQVTQSFAERRITKAIQDAKLKANLSF